MGDELLYLRDPAGDLEDEGSVLASITLARKASASLSARCGHRLCQRDLDQRQLALERPLLAEPRALIDRPIHAVHRHDTLELVLDLLQNMWRRAAHDGDARQVFSCSVSETVRLSMRQPRPDEVDTGKHARLVVDKYGECVSGVCVSLAMK